MIERRRPVKVPGSLQELVRLAERQ